MICETCGSIIFEESGCECDEEEYEDFDDDFQQHEDNLKGAS